MENLIWFVLIFVLYMMYFSPKSEPFELFEQRYGLRGEPWSTYDRRWDYIGPKAHYRVNDSGGYQYVAPGPPSKTEGNCSQVECPEYLNGHADACWKCQI